MRDWEAIQADYVTGAYTARELAVKYEIPDHSTILKRAKREAWTVLDEPTVRQAISSAVAIKEIIPHVPQFPKAIEELADIAITQKRVANKLFSKIEQLVDEVADMREVKDLATAFAQTSSPFKDDRTQIAIQNNNDVSTITRKVVD